MAGIAVAEGIRSRFPQAKIVFFSTGNALEKRCLQGRGFGFYRLCATGWKGSLRNMMVFTLSFIVSLLRCLWALRGLRPDVVFGLGGYASLAPVVSAFILRIPVILIEQNVMPGKANRLLSRWARYVLCHWSSSSKWLKGVKGLHFTGTPLREELFSYEKEKAASHFGLCPAKTTLLVLGGSQGAEAINRVVVECLPSLRGRFPELQIIHSTGKKDYPWVRGVYQDSGLPSRVYDFLEDMGAAYGLADLVLSRAGATTLAELTARGLPAVLIPYPYGADGHQALNARELSARGAAVVLEERHLTAEKLLEIFSELLADRRRLEKIGRSSRALGRPMATQKAVELMAGILQRNEVSSRKAREIHAGACL